jgi:Ase1/PRC1/MAP65 family protein
LTNYCNLPDSERSLILAQISEARDLEFSRKDVLERMDEESWLEEYSRV